MLFYPDGGKPACQQMLRSFAALHPQIDALAHVFAISNESPESNARWASLRDLPFDFLLSDRARAITGQRTRAIAIVTSSI